MVRMSEVRGYLIDLDGTLLVGDRAVDGAAGVLRRLRSSGTPFRVTTNMTRRSRAAISEALRGAGLEVSAAEILTPSILARQRILRSGRRRAALMIPDEARVDLKDLEEAGERPDWVVIGDMGRGFTWDRLNEAFRWVVGGAALLALHKNRYWTSEQEGLVLDAGAFVAALEYASGRTAEMVGKPSPEFFRLALADIDLPAGEVLVVGDDPETDIAGGIAAGCRTALVRTGKFSGGRDDLSGALPDAILDSVAQLPA
jgi:HAD superfamily hydrolase (TIGR01458 family)